MNTFFPEFLYDFQSFNKFLKGELIEDSRNNKMFLEKNIFNKYNIVINNEIFAIYDEIFDIKYCKEVFDRFFDILVNSEIKLIFSKENILYSKSIENSKFKKEFLRDGTIYNGDNDQYIEILKFYSCFSCDDQLENFSDILIQNDLKLLDEEFFNDFSFELKFDTNDEYFYYNDFNYYEKNKLKLLINKKINIYSDLLEHVESFFEKMESYDLLKNEVIFSEFYSEIKDDLFAFNIKSYEKFFNELDDDSDNEIYDSINREISIEWLKDDLSEFCDVTYTTGNSGGYIVLNIDQEVQTVNNFEKIIKIIKEDLEKFPKYFQE